MSLEPSSAELATRRATARAIRERRNGIRASYGSASWKANRSFRPLHAFEKIMEFDQYLDTQSVEVYGVPNETVLGMMKQIGDQFGGSEMSLRVRTHPVAGSTRIR